MSIRWFMRRLALGVVGLATFSSLALVGTTPAQAADPPVAVMVTGEAQVYIVDTPGDDTAPASTSATAQITLLGGATVWVADGSGLRTGDTVSLGVVVPTDLVAALSDADKITLAAAPVIDGVRQVDGTTDLGQALLTATLAATASPEVTALTVVASPSRAPLSPPETAQTTTPAVTAATLTHTVDLVVATAPGAST
ncbi:MAG: hypothetical protein LBI33_09055, partial [Propionibacteriaceae bacterium]|nr:hypothetical protein [Propionibacteriaceae bacterium]